MKLRASYEEPEAEAAEWNSAISNLFIYTCADMSKRLEWKKLIRMKMGEIMFWIFL